jgi:succinate dehydrogenase flavin-adding protein (antitoxin of CptAB toxin-antitoxin module)
MKFCTVDYVSVISLSHAQVKRLKQFSRLMAQEDYPFLEVFNGRFTWEIEKKSAFSTVRNRQKIPTADHTKLIQFGMISHWNFSSISHH